MHVIFRLQALIKKNIDGIMYNQVIIIQPPFGIKMMENTFIFIENIT